jgi:hypothetical protein
MHTNTLANIKNRKKKMSKQRATGGCYFGYGSVNRKDDDVGMHENGLNEDSSLLRSFCIVRVIKVSRGPGIFAHKAHSKKC